MGEREMAITVADQMVGTFAVAGVARTDDLAGD